MLFLGTEKYQQENHYAQFVKKHGGTKNAATGEDYTNYFFDIKSDHFEEALDIFSQFFKCPLFSQSGTEREMNAVDSEFKRNLSNEARRWSQILKTEIARKESILNRF
jgi:insulysin